MGVALLAVGVVAIAGGYGVWRLFQAPRRGADAFRAGRRRRAQPEDVRPCRNRPRAATVVFSEAELNAFVSRHLDPADLRCASRCSGFAATISSSSWARRRSAGSCTSRRSLALASALPSDGSHVPCGSPSPRARRSPPSAARAVAGRPARRDRASARAGGRAAPRAGTREPATDADRAAAEVRTVRVERGRVVIETTSAASTYLSCRS